MVEEGWCIWVTGLPGSGKSIVSKTLIELLKRRGLHAQFMSSDALRKILTPIPTYSLEERTIVYSALVYIATLLTQNSVNVVIDATGNLRLYRDKARRQISRFMEAYLKCPLAVCIRREARRKRTYGAPKGIYGKADSDTSTVPGIGQPYEPPMNPEITVNAAKQKPEECAQEILTLIVERYYQTETRAS